MHRAAIGWAGAFAVLLASGTALAAPGPIVLTPHRAVYDLALARGSGGLVEESSTMTGRMVFEFTGSSCEGWSVTYRMVLETADGEGGSTVTDLRSTTFEEAAGAAYQFLSQTYTNDVLTEEVKGSATRKAEGIDVAVVAPAAKSVTLPPGTLFPTETLLRVIEAARSGSVVVEDRVYDGTEGGDQLYRTTALIGRPLAVPPAGVEARIGERPRWPVTMSYFDAAATGDQTPTYVMTFDLWDNGVSSDLLMDYGDFALTGKLASYEELPRTGDCGQ